MISDEELINCGLRTVQSICRVSIKDICTEYGIKEGQKVEVYIKVKNAKESIIND
jgi:hypothetical protein